MRNDFSSRLSAIVKKIKENEKFRSDYLAMNLHDRDLIRRTRKEAIQQKTLEAARNFYANGVSIGLIAKSLTMTEEEVRELTKDIVPVVADV